MRSFADSRLVFRAALAISIASIAVPILASRYLPFTDAPEHAAVMATLRHWGDPAFSGPYELRILQTQYLVYHLAGAALTLAVGDAELANRLLLALAAVLFPLSFAALLRGAGRDDRLAIFACLPFWSRPLVLGFLPFVASIPIAFYALALFFRALRGARVRAPGAISRTRGAGFVVLAVLLFYLHVSTWLIVVVCAVALAVLARRFRLLLLVVPSAVAASAWLLLGKLTLGGGTLADASEIGRMNVARSLLAMPVWIFDVWRGHGDELAAIAWWLSFLTVTIKSARSIARYSRRALALLYAPLVCVVAVYLLTPWRVGAAVMLNVRLAPIVVLFAFLPMRLPRRSAVVAAALGLALVANVAGGITAMVQCRTARAELGELDTVLATMPPGSRLMTLNFDIRSRVTHIFPWAHVGSYHRVRAGGVTGFSFSELNHWPLAYKPSERPPVKEHATWDFDPCTFRNAVDGAYYDFVLVRGDVDPFAREPAGPIFRRVVAAGAMTLYRKESGIWDGADVPDRGPCVRAGGTDQRR